MEPPESQLSPLQKKAVGRKLLEAEIIARAWEDDAFRAKLETDPAAALAEAGLPVPQGRKIKVTTEAPGTLTLPLPQTPAEAGELEDTDLDAVAGGGLIQNGRCELTNTVADEYRYGNMLTQGAALLGAGVAAVFGGSWGWG